MKSKLDEFVSDSRNALLLEQEALVVSATELITRLMEEKSISRVEMAEALETSKSNISQLLDGTRNMTLKTLASLAYVMNQRVKFDLQDIACSSVGSSRDDGVLFQEFVRDSEWDIAVPAARALRPRLVYDRRRLSAPTVDSNSEGGAPCDTGASVAA